MIIINLHQRYCYSNIKEKYGKDQIDIFVFGTETRSGELIQAWSSAFPAPTLPFRPDKGTRLEFTENKGSQRRNHTQSHQKRPAERESGKIRMGGLFGQNFLGGNLQTFFIRPGARYGRIRKCPGGKPSPQPYACKRGKLQGLENQCHESIIELYYGDESHVCTGGYAPYGRQFKGEDCYVPCGEKFRLNCFGIIDRDSNYDGVTTTESINADKIIEYLDHLSLRITKKTIVVLDNTRIHRAKKVMG